MNTILNEPIIADDLKQKAFEIPKLEFKIRSFRVLNLDYIGRSYRAITKNANFTTARFGGIQKTILNSHISQRRPRKPARQNHQMSVTGSKDRSPIPLKNCQI